MDNKPIVTIGFKYWQITYWTKDEDGEGTFKQIECAIKDKELGKLNEKDARFIQVIVDEGQTAFLSIENINYLEEIRSLVDR